MLNAKQLDFVACVRPLPAEVIAHIFALQLASRPLVAKPSENRAS
jgi:hypothetical protein